MCCSSFSCANASLSNARIARIKEKMHEQGLDAVYVRLLSNIRWATAFEKVFDTEDAHALLILPEKTVIHSDSRYGAALDREAQGTSIEVSLVRKTHFECLLNLLEFSPAERSELASKHATQHVKHLGKSHSSKESQQLKIGVENTISLAEFRAIQRKLEESQVNADLVELSGFVETLRECKDRHELDLMRKAQAITDAAFSHIVTYIQPGMTEKQVQRELENKMYELGADGLAFSSIVAAGPRGALPHSVPGDDVIQTGDCIVMDFGASYGGYCSDMTRTVFIGEPSDKMRQAWNVLVKANETCESFIKPGVIASDVHEKAEEILAAGGFAATMGHSLGHSVGIDVHEAPTLSPSNHEPLCKGNVITVEPGIYLENEFGMRLEDFGVVTEQGFEVITQSSHEMVIIEPCK